MMPIYWHHYRFKLIHGLLSDTSNNKIGSTKSFFSILRETTTCLIYMTSIKLLSKSGCFIIHIMIVLFLSLNFLSASETKQENTISTNLSKKALMLIDSVKKSGDKGFLIEFQGNPKLKSSRLQLSFYSKTKGEMSGDFVIANLTDSNHNFTLAVLVDYKVTKFSTGGEEKLYVPVKIPSQQHIKLPIYLSNISNGGHDIIIMAINSNPEKDIYSSDIPVLYRRANFFYKNKDMPKITYHVANEEKNVSEYSLIVINRSNKIDDFTELSSNIDQLDKNNNNDYFIHINNESETSSRYALVAINSNSSNPIVSENYNLPSFIKINEKRSAMIPFNTNSNDPGDKIRILLFREPTVQLEIENGVMNQVDSELIITKNISIIKQKNKN